MAQEEYNPNVNYGQHNDYYGEAEPPASVGLRTSTAAVQAMLAGDPTRAQRQSTQAPAPAMTAYERHLMEQAQQAPTPIHSFLNAGARQQGAAAQTVVSQVEPSLGISRTCG